MAAYRDLVEAGHNYRPAPWKIAKTIFHCSDLADTPDIPPLRNVRCSAKTLRMDNSPPQYSSLVSRLDNLSNIYN